MVTLAVVLTILISLWVTVDKERQYLAELGQQRQQLQLEVGQLQTQVADLTKLGGKIKLKHCGPENRLCVRVDTENVYGPTGDYLTVKED